MVKKEKIINKFCKKKQLADPVTLGQALAISNAIVLYPKTKIIYILPRTWDYEHI